METFTWYNNMYNYYYDLAHVALRMGFRIDPTCVNEQLGNLELELVTIRNKYDVVYDK